MIRDFGMRMNGLKKTMLGTAVVLTIGGVAASTRAGVIATDNFDGLDPYPYAVGYGSNTPDGGQWHLTATSVGGTGRTDIDNGSFGYGGIGTPQSGTGYGQFSNGNFFTYTGSITDTATHTFNVGDSVSVSFYMATRTDGTGVPLDVVLVPTGGGTPIVDYGFVTPPSSDYTLTTTTPFTITTAGSYDVSFIDPTPTSGDLTTLIDTVSYNVASAVPEPTSLGLIGLGSMGLLARRRGQAALARRF